MVYIVSTQYLVPGTGEERRRGEEEEEAREAIATETIVDDPVTSKTKEL